VELSRSLPIPDSRIVGDNEPTGFVEDKAVYLKPLLNYLMPISAPIIPIEPLADTVRPKQLLLQSIPNWTFSAQVVVVCNDFEIVHEPPGLAVRHAAFLSQCDVAALLTVTHRGFSAMVL
jgi:hypothetical protein